MSRVGNCNDVVRALVNLTEWKTNQSNDLEEEARCIFIDCNRDHHDDLVVDGAHGLQEVRRRVGMKTILIMF